VDASQNVGIGTASPTQKLDVNGISVFGSGDKLNVYSNNVLQSAGTLDVGTNGSAALIFNTNNTERMRVNAGAPILCLSGGSTTATGTGIAFPASQSASTDANTLDDYEEGIWTPAVNLLGTLTYAVQLGWFVKVGKLVTVGIYISASSTDTTQDGAAMQISGLPYAHVNSIRANSTAAIMTEKMKGPSSPTAPNFFFVMGVSNDTKLNVMQSNYNGTISQSSFYTQQLRSGYAAGNLYIQGVYSYESAS
jgi:hypothetical protein